MHTFFAKTLCLDVVAAYFLWHIVTNNCKWKRFLSNAWCTQRYTFIVHWCVFSAMKKLYLYPSNGGTIVVWHFLFYLLFSILNKFLVLLLVSYTTRSKAFQILDMTRGWTIEEVMKEHVCPYYMVQSYWIYVLLFSNLK